ncbi:MAG: hypothetical protein KAJ54_03140 [Candidatus Aenigmarchaeota archaeon]|nr:hypothetical protein [Candidatus Aenigmarchaeota archaeon]MCK5322121.1 hypothetical protein [Candidatus Aenigmarchaeota archaeon]
MECEDIDGLKREVYNLAEKIEEKRIITNERKKLNNMMEILVRYGKKLDEEYVNESRRFDDLRDNVEKAGMRYDK